MPEFPRQAARRERKRRSGTPGRPTPQIERQEAEIVNCRHCLKPITGKWVSTSRVFCGKACARLWRGGRIIELNGLRPPLSSGHIGALHELLACADLIRRGYEVFRAVSPASPFDLIIFSKRGMERVEVRTAVRMPDGTIRTNSSDRCDILAMVFYDGTVQYRPEI